ncbi:pleckstrin homology domain-containing protein 1-like isoform X2 [Physcomitrium patens]|uniref:pleckstrin homology domain-containing protein 1-like isoform X2 n=1 Tax=Physcomitrium patens TaxID=3218 RepID=UPI003CCD5854
MLAIVSVDSLSKSRSILVGRNLTVESAENVLNNQFVYELSMNSCIMYFIPDTDKEKRRWDQRDWAVYRPSFQVGYR